MGKKKEMVYLGVCVSPATHEELKKLAAEKELSMSTLVRQLIKEYLASEQKSA
jgi:ribbon-helix-helix protein, copG family